MPLSVEWRSLAPAVASVSPEGRIAANRLGRASVVATYRDWLTDTVHVEVAGELREDVLFRPDLSAPLEEAWEIDAFPRPRPTSRDGQTVISLEGDGRYGDRILSRESFSLEQGATLELEFRLPFTDRRDRQSLSVCVMREPGSAEQGRRQGACMKYPWGELAHFDPRTVGVHYRHLGVAWTFPVPTDPSADWTHVALQVRPDGRVSLYWNRELVDRPELPLRIPAGSRWIVELAGASVETELLVRNLTLWRGTRFSDPAEAGPEDGGRGG